MGVAEWGAVGWVGVRVGRCGTGVRQKFRSEVRGLGLALRSSSPDLRSAAAAGRGGERRRTTAARFSLPLDLLPLSRRKLQVWRSLSLALQG